MWIYQYLWWGYTVVVKALKNMWGPEGQGEVQHDQWYNWADVTLQWRVGGNTGIGCLMGTNEVCMAFYGLASCTWVDACVWLCLNFLVCPALCAWVWFLKGVINRCTGYGISQTGEWVSVGGEAKHTHGDTGCMCCSNFGACGKSQQKGNQPSSAAGRQGASAASAWSSGPRMLLFTYQVMWLALTWKHGKIQKDHIPPEVCCNLGVMSKLQLTSWPHQHLFQQQSNFLSWSPIQVFARPKPA